MRGTRLMLIALLAAVTAGPPQAAGASPAAAPRHRGAAGLQDLSLAVAPVGTAPAFAAENYQTRTMYVPNSGDGTVSVVNLTACNALNVSGCTRNSPVIRVGNLPLGIAVDQATNTVYVANALDNTVSVINGATCDASDTSGCGQKPVTVRVGSFGDAVAVDPVTNTVFVTNQNARPGTVSVIDGNSCTGSHPSGCAHQPLATVKVGGGPSGITVNPATNTVYVANTGENSNPSPVPHGNTVSVIDGAKCHAGNTSGCAAIGTVPVGTSPAAVAVDPVTNSVYTVNTYDGSGFFENRPIHEGTVSVINGATCDASNPSGCAAQKPPQVTVGRDPIGLAADDANHTVYITNSLDDTVSVINAATCNATQTSGCTPRPPTFALGGAPSWPLVDAARHTVYIADQVSNNIAVLSDLSCNASTPSGCRRPAQTVPAGHLPNATASADRYHTVYVGDAGAFHPPYTVSMIDTTACNAADHRGCTRPPTTLDGYGVPLSIAANQHTNTVYVASSGPLQVINAATCNAGTTAGCGRTAKVPAGGFAVAVDQSTDTIYTANTHPDGSGYISVIDGRHCNAADTSGCAGQTTVATPRVGVGHDPGDLAIDPVTHTLYVTNIGDHTVSVIDTRHCHAGDTSHCASQTPATIPMPAGAGSSVHVDSATNAVYVTNLNDSTVSVIDGRQCNAGNMSHCGPVRNVEVGSNPADLTIDQQNDTVYVPNFYDNDASVFPVLKSAPAPIPPASNRPAGTRGTR